MKTFQMWYSTGEYGKMWFDAEDIDQARELIEKLEQGEITPDELPNFTSTIKGGDGWEFSDLQEWGD